MNQISPFLRRLVAVVAFVLVAAACGNDSDDALITIDGVTMMTVDELGSTFDRSLIVPALNYGIQTEALAAELAERGGEVTDAHRQAAQEEFDALREADPASMPEPDSVEARFLLRRIAVLNAVADHLADQGVEPASPGTLCSSHILVPTEEEAQAAIDRLDAGEDFADLARELSTGPSAPDGGDIGCFSTTQLDPGYVAGARATEVGGVSEPTQSSFGWHVIEVHSFDEDSLDDPAARRDAFLATDAFAEFEEAAFTDVEIEVNPDFGTYDPATGVTAAG